MLKHHQRHWKQFYPAMTSLSFCQNRVLLLWDHLDQCPEVIEQ